jgi:hypothetical protein
VILPLRAANLLGSERNVTGVGSPVGPFEAPKSGSPGISAAGSKVDLRWDEKADPPRSTLCCVGLQAYASSMWTQNGRRIGP